LFVGPERAVQKKGEKTKVAGKKRRSPWEKGQTTTIWTRATVGSKPERSHLSLLRKSSKDINVVAEEILRYGKTRRKTQGPKPKKKNAY